jgi:hypothetical protein
MAVSAGRSTCGTMRGGERPGRRWIAAIGPCLAPTLDLDALYSANLIDGVIDAS